MRSLHVNSDVQNTVPTNSDEALTERTASSPTSTRPVCWARAEASMIKTYTGSCAIKQASVKQRFSRRSDICGSHLHRPYTILRSINNKVDRSIQEFWSLRNITPLSRRVEPTHVAGRHFVRHCAKVTLPTCTMVDKNGEWIHIRLRRAASSQITFLFCALMCFVCYHVLAPCNACTVLAPSSQNQPQVQAAHLLRLRPWAAQALQAEAGLV